MTDEPTPIRGHRSGEGWHLEPRRRYLFVAIGILGAAVMIGPGIAAAFQGKWLAAGLLFILGGALGVLPFGRTRRRLPARDWTDGTLRGVLLPVHPMKLVTIAATGLLGTVLVVAGIGIGAEGIAKGTYGQLLGAAISLAIGLLLLLGSYAGVRSRIASDRGLVLMPGGVVWRTLREPITLPWDDIMTVRAHWRRRVRGVLKTIDEPINNWLTFDLRPEAAPTPDALALLSGTGDPSLDAESLAVDPDVVLAVLRFYLDAPDRRTELATDAGLARVAELERSLAPT